MSLHHRLITATPSGLPVSAVRSRYQGAARHHGADSYELLDGHLLRLRSPRASHGTGLPGAPHLPQDLVLDMSTLPGFRAVAHVQCGAGRVAVVSECADGSAGSRWVLTVHRLESGQQELSQTLRDRPDSLRFGPGGRQVLLTYIRRGVTGPDMMAPRGEQVIDLRPWMGRA